MKRILLLVGLMGFFAAAMASNTNPTFAPWQPYGNSNFTSVQNARKLIYSDQANLVFNGSGQAYFAKINGNKNPEIFERVHNTWTKMSDVGLSSTTHHLRIAINTQRKNATPYLFYMSHCYLAWNGYQECTQLNTAHWDGSAWQPVGNQDSLPSGMYFEGIDIAISHHGRPYLFYAATPVYETESVFGLLKYSYRTHQWFSSAPIITNQFFVKWISSPVYLAFSKNNTPLVSYTVVNQSAQNMVVAAALQKNNTWKIISNSIPAGGSGYAIAISNAGVPYVLNVSNNLEQIPYVEKWSATKQAWETVGSFASKQFPFLYNGAQDLFLNITNNGTPVVSFYAVNQTESAQQGFALRYDALTQKWKMLGDPMNSTPTFITSNAAHELLLGTQGNNPSLTIKKFSGILK